MTQWSPQETGKHQDHVIAHVVGTTVLGYFFDAMAVHLSLDIGFIWTIYLDGEMGMLPEGVALSELEVSDEVRAMLVDELRVLHNDGGEGQRLVRVSPAPVDCLIEEVEFYANGDGRRVFVRGEAGSLVVETSLATGEMRVVGVD